MYKTIPEAAKESGIHRTTLNKAAGRHLFDDAIRETQEHRGKVIEIDTNHPQYTAWLESRRRPITPRLEYYEPNQGTYKPVMEEAIRYMTEEEIAFVDQLIAKDEQASEEQ